MRKSVVLWSVVLAVLLLSGCAYKPYSVTATPDKQNTTTSVKNNNTPIQSTEVQREVHQGIGLQVSQFSWYIIFLGLGYCLGKKGINATIKDINSKIRRTNRMEEK